MGIPSASAMNSNAELKLLMAARNSDKAGWQFPRFLKTLKTGLPQGALLALLGCLATLYFLPVRYEANDDLGILFYLTGLDGFTRASDVPFMSRILGEGLFACYSQFPSIPWYGLTIYAVTWLGVSCFLSQLFVQHLDVKSRLVAGLGWAIFLGHFVSAVTFTSAALILLLGSTLYLFSWAANRQNARISWIFLWLCVATAYLVRWKATLGFSLFAAPVLIYLRRDDWRYLLRCGLALALLVVIDRSWDHLAKDTVDFREYQHYAKLRSAFHDSPQGRPGPNTPQALAAAGWTLDDYRSFRNHWLLYDESLFQPERLATFLRENESAGVSSRLQRFRASLALVWSSNRNYLLFFFSLAVALLRWRWRDLFVAPHGDWRRTILVFLLVLLPLLLVLAYRMPTRVCLPILAYFLGIGLCLPASADDRRGKRTASTELGSVINLVTVAVLLGGVAVAVHQLRSEVSSLKTDREHKEFVQQSLADFATGPTDSPVLMRLEPGVALMQTSIHPLRERADWIDLRVMPGGWQIGSPRYREVLAELGFESGAELLRESIDNEGILYVIYDRPWDHILEDVIERWESYFNRHVRTKEQAGEMTLRLELLRQFEEDSGAHFNVYVFRSASPLVE